jgi:hypothetical protein
LSKSPKFIWSRASLLFSLAAPQGACLFFLDALYQLPAKAPKKSDAAGFLPCCFFSCLLIYGRHIRVNHATLIFRSAVKREGRYPLDDNFAGKLFFCGMKTDGTKLLK